MHSKFKHFPFPKVRHYNSPLSSLGNTWTNKSSGYVYLQVQHVQVSIMLIRKHVHPVV